MGVKTKGKKNNDNVAKMFDKDGRNQKYETDRECKEKNETEKRSNVNEGEQFKTSCTI